MTADQIYEVLASVGIQPESVRLRDNEYVLFDRVWLAHIFAPAFQKFLRNLDAQAYIAEANDCDDFADCAAWYARYLHRHVGNGRAIAAAFGTFSYVRADGAGGHCINFALVKGPSGAEFLFLEPQTGEVVNLSPVEIASCSEARI